MSNGGGESGRQLEQPNYQRKLSGDNFAQAVAKVAVAQVCESQGFQGLQQSALELLSDIVVRYIQNIGETAHYHANLAGRTECNVLDVIQGLEDLGAVQGFAGASDVDHCLESSGIIADIVHFVTEAEQIPFAYPIPHFPVVKERVLPPSFLQIGEEPPGEHIPAWLPTFPHPQTYAQSPTWNGRAMEPQAANVEHEREKGKGGQYFSNLQQQRLVLTMSEKSSLIEVADANAQRVAVENNPFLCAPLQFGDKSVSSVVPPAKLSIEVASKNPVLENCVEDKSISVLETFCPAIEAMKSTMCDSEEEQKNHPLSKRPTVRFKLGIGDKFLSRLTDFSPQKQEKEKTLPLVAMEGDKDDSKRRAEKILKESLENHDKLVQL